jgi:hypothetical protein
MTRVKITTDENRRKHAITVTTQPPIDAAPMISVRQRGLKT